MDYYFYSTTVSSADQTALAREFFKTSTGYDYVKDERGKPYIPNSDLHMSISHCSAGIVCIVADFPVGIDVEIISRMNLRIATKVCTPNELTALESAENPQELLCRMWVLKEAEFKRTGQSITAIDTTADVYNFYAEKKDGNPSLYVGIAY
jgi:4'-phosphopantetheinyl transferase